MSVDFLTVALEVGVDGFLRVHLVFEFLMLSFPTEVLLVPLYDNRVRNHSVRAEVNVRRAHSNDGADIGAPRWIEMENLERVERRCSRKSYVGLTLLECTGEIDPYAL